MSHPVRLQTGSHRDSHQDSDHSLQTGTAIKTIRPGRPSDLDSHQDSDRDSHHQTWTAIRTQTGEDRQTAFRPGQPSQDHQTWTAIKTQTGRLRPGQPSRLRPHSDRDSHQDSDHTHTGTTLTPGQPSRLRPQTQTGTAASEIWTAMKTTKQAKKQILNPATKTEVSSATDLTIKGQHE